MVSGVIGINSSIAFTLTRNANFTPHCTTGSAGVLTNSGDNSSTVVNIRDPFYASVAPQFFAIAIATVVSYVLVIIIFITPGTSGVSGSRGGAAFPGRRGMISGSYGSSSVVGIGRRPWLQKIAAITVAISLTIACADTFKFAERQYNNGFSDAVILVDTVNASVEIRVVRVISDTFLWLAQVQTLIRLFPRHKEKVTIKWLGFALILFDTVFDILNNFVYQSAKSRPRRFQDAIPALSYLFELAIGLIYASCVIYYSFIKRRFAFWHTKMRNICLVAMLSLMAVLIPVVFFVLDVSKPDVAGWGNYILWVGAAAASVVVWEWVERIEALERDERKDGILGREIFDGDEMLDMIPSEEVVWPGQRPNRDRDNESGDGTASGWTRGGATSHRPLRSRVPFQSRTTNDRRAGNALVTATAGRELGGRISERSTALPLQAITPISRTDTSSASTIYAVRRLTLNTPSPRIPEDPSYAALAVTKAQSFGEPESVPLEAIYSGPSVLDGEVVQFPSTKLRSKKNPTPLWRAVHNPFKRRRASPPAEVAGAQTSGTAAPLSTAANEDSHVGLGSRVDAFATSQKRRFRARGEDIAGNDPLVVTVIPAQRRGQRTWSPDDLAQPTADESDDANEHTLDHYNDRNGSQSRDPRNEDFELPLTVIPAPIRGQRTWSPQDVFHQSPGSNSREWPTDGIRDPVQDAPGLERSSTSEETRSRPSSNELSLNSLDGKQTAGTFFHRRGTLIISEDEARTSSGSYRRSTYTRTSPLSIRPGSTPIDSVAEDQHHEPEGEPPPTPDPEVAVSGWPRPERPEPIELRAGNDESA